MNIAIIYRSTIRNTKIMAVAIAQGVQSIDELVTLFEATLFEVSMINNFDCFAFGFSSMQAKQLKEREFEPMYSSFEADASSKDVLTFGSYRWRDGQWMREWAKRIHDARIDSIYNEKLMIHETSDQDRFDQWNEAGKGLGTL